MENSSVPQNSEPSGSLEQAGAPEPIKTEVVTGSSGSTDSNNKPPKSKALVSILRFLVIGGGFFIVLVIGLGISFSACFTIKGPPPPVCAPVSFVSLLLLPAGSLFILIPLARKIK